MYHLCLNTYIVMLCLQLTHTLIVGSLLYLGVASRPDIIMYAVEYGIRDHTVELVQVTTSEQRADFRPSPDAAMCLL